MRRSPRPCSRGASWRRELRAERRRWRQRRACRRLAAEVDLRAGAVGQEVQPAQATQEDEGEQQAGLIRHDSDDFER
eukprot:7989218-Alexandrium_andersonii.AAC.1